MFLEKVKSEGLAHLSYVGGAAGEAFVVDPRRDCEIYNEIAQSHDHRITHIFETHRNEDLVTGSIPLARATGARIIHGDAPPDQRVDYADFAHEGDEFHFGALRIRVLETPGHTDDSLSYVLYDDEFGPTPAGVFTGDALFVGDVGRTDFYPDRAEEVAGLLYDSLQKLLALGDQAIVWPAHGAGSVCGGGLAEREFSTIGFERLHNPALSEPDRRAFIRRKLGEHHYKPPYFRAMEQANTVGAEPMPRMLAPLPYLAEPADLGARARIVDVRDTTDFLGAHVPGSLSLPVPMIAGFAGWLLDYEQDLVLVAASDEQAALAARHLARIGYDRVMGRLAAKLPDWAAGGRPFRSIAALDAANVAERCRAAGAWTLLDVRTIDETRDALIDDSRHIYLGHLPERLDELDRRRHYTTMCATGVRATIAASLLLADGFEHVDVFLGSMGAWRSTGLPARRAAAHD
jgi:hydroxyacylglutathione hydrolase